MTLYPHSYAGKAGSQGKMVSLMCGSSYPEPFQMFFCLSMPYLPNTLAKCPILETSGGC